MIWTVTFAGNSTVVAVKKAVLLIAGLRLDELLKFVPAPIPPSPLLSQLRHATESRKQSLFGRRLQTYTSLASL